MREHRQGKSVSKELPGQHGMSGRLKIQLKANERIFINGGAFRVDRKVAIELLNDVVFLLDSHVMSQDQATTPLRQLYFAVQSMMLEPRSADLSRRDFERLCRGLAASAEGGAMHDALVEVEDLVERNKPYDALKRIRTLFEHEPAKRQPKGP
jgi:flagellar protein FlbT